MAASSAADEQAGFAAGANASEPKTNMLLLLIPWIVFWVAAAIDGFWGSLLSIAICVLVACSDASNEGYLVRPDFRSGGWGVLRRVAGRSVLCSDYSGVVFPVRGDVDSHMLCFKVPLTAHYSKNSYNGEAALRNPIFMRTNRILTAAWGVLYLITPVWTYSHHAN